MTRFLFVLIAAGLTAGADDGRLADAIYRAEGGKLARVPYGITTMHVRDANHARQICLRTIRSARRDWDGHGDFLVHLGRRYCPPSVDPTGHRNWVLNTRRLYRP